MGNNLTLSDDIDESVSPEDRHTLKSEVSHHESISYIIKAAIYGVKSSGGYFRFGRDIAEIKILEQGDIRIRKLN